MATTTHPDRALEDIRDVEAFSGAVVRRSLAKRMLPEEIEEAIAEGVVLLYELHGKWNAKRTPSFATWCGTMLQLRLIDWWRREMRQRNLAHKADVNCSSYIYVGRVSLEERAAFEDRMTNLPSAEPTRSDSALTTHDTREGD